MNTRTTKKVRYPKCVDVESLEHAADCFRNCAGMIESITDGEEPATLANIQRVVHYCKIFGTEGAQRVSDAVADVPEHHQNRW